MECRIGCGACCIAPSISSSIPGMMKGKPAGVRCIQLFEDNRCKLFGNPDRPTICTELKATIDMCGKTTKEAFEYLEMLEKSTKPNIDL